MNQRICPVCDQAMKSAHYCRNCKRWVKHPYVRESTYYLNERHPEYEADCSYHSPDVHRILKAEQKAMKQSVPSDGGIKPYGDRKPNAGWRPVELSKNIPLPQQMASLPATPRSGSRAVLGVILAAVLISIVTYFSGPAIRAVRHALEPASGYDSDFDIYFGEEAESNYRELEEEDIIARKEACSGRGHFSIDGSTMVQPVRAVLQEVGYQIVGQNTSTYNEVHEDGSTWYSTWTSIEVTCEGEYGTGYQTVALDFDTGTGKLHEVSLSLDHPDMLVETTCAILELLAEEGELSENAECLTLVAKELPGAVAGGNGYARLDGHILIEGIAYNQSYSVYISHNKSSDL